MDFDLPETALAVRDGVRAVAAKYDHAYWSRCEEEHRFPTEVYQDLCEGGALGWHAVGEGVEARGRFAQVAELRAIERNQLGGREVAGHGHVTDGVGEDPRQDQEPFRRAAGVGFCDFDETLFLESAGDDLSIYDNIAFGIGLNRSITKAQMDSEVEVALRRVALWDEVKDQLLKSGLELSGGQQQRLSIARAIAVRPPIRRWSLRRWSLRRWH